MVTHDAFSASHCDRILFIRDGQLFHQLVRGTESRKQFFDRIIEVVALLGGDVTDVA
jgi:putative ABC transport system ATP-binding protein